MSAKILVVDDEPNMVRLLRLALEVDGFRVVTAADGVQALEQVAREKPDLVILDVMLPQMSGLDVCRRLRAQPATTNLPIIMLSALTNVPDKISGLEAGADDYVTKPVDPAEISARVKAMLARTARLQVTRPLKRGGVLAFIGAKGGVGTTTVAVNVAVSLAQKKKAVLAVDLRPFVGTFALQLGLKPKQDLSHLLSKADDGLDKDLISRALVRHASGLRMLAAPHSIGDLDALSGEFVSSLLEQSLSMAEWVVLDLPGQVSAANRRALEMSKAVLLVTEPVAASLIPARAVMGFARRSVGSECTLGVVMVNRMGYTMAISKEQAEEALGAAVVAAIPMAGETLFAAQQSGNPVVAVQPESAAAQALLALAERLAEL